MIYRRIHLQDFDQRASKDATLDIYLYEDCRDLPWKKRPSVLVIPGGGYFSLAPLEGENVSCRYYSEGFNAFHLHYAIFEKYPKPHLDLAIAMAYIRFHQEEFHLSGDISLIGFSAGGHLAGSYGYLYPDLASMLGIQKEEIAPTRLILAYPVISLLENAHLATRDYIAGEDESLRKLLSIEEHVSKDYPPTFLFVLPDDQGVSAQHSYGMIRALEEAEVPHDAFIAPRLDHGQSILSIENKRSFSPLTYDEKYAKQWVDRSIGFILRTMKTK